MPRTGERLRVERMSALSSAHAPRAIITSIEAAPTLPPGADERVAGYGVMGLPFTSGHYLAMRRFPVSSFGGAYTAVWWREPAGAWHMFSDVEPMLSCPRFF